MTYLEFLKTKIEVAPETGFEVGDGEIHPALKPHQRDAVRWALRGGRRALFESFGLGKTVQELEFCRQVLRHEGGNALIVLPLGVRQEFKHDAVELLGMDEPAYITSAGQAREDGKIYLTNYERVRDGDIDPRMFSVCVLDEAAVLRSFGSKTYQTFLPKFKGVKYKLVATATPAPNRLKELIHYAGFLEVMEPRPGIVDALKKQLDREQITGKLIHLCFTCDPYPTGYDTSATREVIKAIKASGNHVQILTKGDGSRDFDLLDENDWYGITFDGAKHGIYEPSDRLVDLLSVKQFGIKTWVSFEPVIDAGKVLDCIRECHDFIDKAKIGKLNYFPSSINWKQFGQEAEALCLELGIDYYIKDDLRKEMEKP